ncbi:MAG: hypothetical protein ACE363_03680 [Alphaproteobacteria bacterium]
MDFSFLYKFEWLIIELMILAILFNELWSLKKYERRKKQKEAEDAAQARDKEAH